MDQQDGPFLAMAVFCERVLEEKTGVLSLIRVIDRLQIEGAPMPSQEAPPLPASLTAVVSFKAGSARGSHNLAIRPESPAGLHLPEASLTVLFEGEDRGVNAIVGISVPIQQEGLYWFDVLLDGQRVTRMPLRIVYQRIGFGYPTPS